MDKCLYISLHNGNTINPHNISLWHLRDYSGNGFVSSGGKTLFRNRRLFYWRVQSQRRLIDRTEADANRILTTPSSPAKWTERAAGAVCSLQGESRERRHLVEKSTSQHTDYRKHEIYWDRSGTEGPTLSSGGLPAAAERQPPSCVSWPPAEESSPTWWKDRGTSHTLPAAQSKTHEDVKGSPPWRALFCPGAPGHVRRLPIW